MASFIVERKVSLSKTRSEFGAAMLEIAVIVLGESLGSRWTRLRSFAASARRKSHIVTPRDYLEDLGGLFLETFSCGFAEK